MEKLRKIIKQFKEKNQPETKVMLYHQMVKNNNTSESWKKMLNKNNCQEDNDKYLDEYFPGWRK